MKKILKFSSKELRKNIIFIIIYLCISIGSNVLLKLMPYMNGAFIDQLVYFKNSASIFKFIVIASSIISISYFLGYIGGILNTKLQTKISFDIYKKVLTHVNRIPVSKLNNMNLAALNQRVITDINTIVTFIISTLESMIINIFLISLSFAFIFTINKWFSVFFLLFCGLYYISNKFLKDKIYRISYRYKEQQNLYFAKTHEQYNSAKFVKMQGMEGTFINRLNKPFLQFLNAAIANQKICYLYSGMDTLINLILQIVLISFCGNAIIHGKMTIGEFTIINSYILMATGCMKYFYSLGKNIQGSLASLDRLYEILNIEPEKSGNLKKEDIQKIELCNLKFGYQNEELLDGMDYEFKKGKIYAVIGKNGAGKSTLFYLLLGLYNEEISGKIKIDGIPINHYDLNYLRSQIIGYLEQNPFIISDTISENLFLMREEDREKFLSLLHFINLHPLDMKGYSEYMESSAESLSGGEKLRLSLLRLFYKNPQLLMLDEPSSMLDKTTVEKLAAFLNSIKKDKIIILVTHDEKLISISDEVIELKR